MTPQLISAELVRECKRRLEVRQADIEAFIRQLVEIESPSGDEVGSKAVVDLIAASAGSIPCISEIERVDVPHFGQHVVFRAFQEQASAGQVLLVGHTDTVHSRGSIAERPWRIEAGKAYGPGVFDMKGSFGLSLEVLRLLSELQITPARAITIVLTCDEEIGSATGWPLIERITKSQHTSLALVMEPPASEGRVKTGRKGTGIFAIKVHGKAAHAGLEPEKGASAILELARQTERIHSLNGTNSGITTNVGVMRGGTRSNVVAAEAEGEIDVRFSTEAESREVERFLKSLQPIDERTQVFVSGGINRPPMERTAAVIEVFERARQIGAMFDYEVGEAQVGGASDGNFLAALGIPVLDGLGIKGDGAHAVHENIELDDIPRRGALLAGLLASS
jgi:glutamate carboxypeptidase